MHLCNTIFIVEIIDNGAMFARDIVYRILIQYTFIELIFGMFHTRVIELYLSAYFYQCIYNAESLKLLCKFLPVRLHTRNMR